MVVPGRHLSMQLPMLDWKAAGSLERSQFTQFNGSQKRPGTWDQHSSSHDQIDIENKECKGKYYLPSFGEEYAEPITLVSNHVVIERIQMQKDDQQRGLATVFLLQSDEDFEVDYLQFNAKYACARP